MKPISGSPLDRVLTIALILAPAVGLLSTVLYAARGWYDPIAGVVHVIAAILGALLVVRLVTYLDRLPVLAAVALVVGLVGAAGNVAYGFNTIEVSLGNVDLVDQPGAANLIKPLGLCWPLGLLLLGAGLLRARRVPVWVGWGIVVASAAYPVSRIGNIAWLALVLDVVLLVCFAAIPFVLRGASDAAIAAGGGSDSDRSPGAVSAAPRASRPS
jgi:hypothetical protein